MKIFCFIAFLMVDGISAFSQGHIDLGRVSNFHGPHPIFRLVDPCDPLADKTKVLGSGYTAQLWFAFGKDRSEVELGALRDYSGTFDRDGFVHFFPGRNGLIEGALPGEFVTIQLRVWENIEGAIISWEDANHSTIAAYGKSVVGNYELGGIAPDGRIVLNQSIFRGMSPITISAVCPEPSSYLLLGLGAGCGVFMRRRGAGVMKHARVQD